MTSSTPTPRTFMQLRREIESSGRPIFHATALKTPQSKLNTSVLISATATRDGGNVSRSATTPRVEDEASHAPQPSRPTPTSMKTAPPPLQPSRRLPMNMVVSQIARRRAPSPAREKVRETAAQRVETPTLDPFLEQLLNFRPPGPKTGSLPHPDDLMGARLRRFRKQEGPEDDIHRRFVAVYGDAEANLSAGKKLRLARTHDDEEEELETPHRSQLRRERSVMDTARTRPPEVPWKDHSPVHRSPPANSRYLELYGGVSQQSCADPPRSLPEETWSILENSPPHKLMSSYKFLRTASEVSSYETFDDHHYPSVPQESSWKKYLHESQQEEKENSWIIESSGNSNKEHHGTSSNIYNYYVKNDNFKPKFVLSNNYDYNTIPSPALPGKSPELAHRSRMLRGETVTRSDLPESAKCSWLYESLPPAPLHYTNSPSSRQYTRSPPVPRQYRRDTTTCKRVEKDDDEISSFLQDEKESLFSSTPEEDAERCNPEE